MKDALPFIISGIAIGSVYGLASTGLVLTYKTSGIFNFGHGALATLAAYVFYFLHIDHGWNWIPAGFVSVFVVGPLLGLLMELISRQLSRQATSHKIVATVGMIVFVQGLATRWYGSTTINVPQFLPHSGPTDSFELGGVFIGYGEVIVTAIALVVVASLYTLFRYSRLGLSMRAVVDDPDLVDLSGTSPPLVRRIAWLIGSTFAALSGVLLLPLIGLQSIGLTLLVAQAFGAAAFGAFSSIPLAFAGGLVVGVAADLSKKYVLDISWLSGFPASVPFIVLIAALLILPKRKLTPPSSFERRPPLYYRAPANIRLVVGTLVIVGLALVPTFAGYRLSYFMVGITQAVLLLSLGLLVRTSGQVSLCHTTFAAVGAVTFSQLAYQHHVPWGIALLAGGLMAVPVGALVAIPAIRLSGLFLALATFGFGIAVESLFYSNGLMFTGKVDGRRMPRPSIAQGDKAYYYLLLIALIVVVAIIVAVHDGRLGRLLRGMSDAPVAVTTLGLSTNLTRVIVFCLSAFLAGIAGVLYGCSANFATTGDARFGSFQSLILIAILALAPFREPWYAVFIAVTSVIPGYISGSNVQNYMNLVFGFFAITVSLQGGQPAMTPRLQAFFNRLGRTRPQDSPTAETVGPAPKMVADTSRTGLEVRDLTVRFGGLTAVQSLDLAAPVGRITGLIGPNGAGKTTTFNACSGLIRPSSGSIVLHGHDVSHLSPAGRGRHGLGRTFQLMQLAESLTVEDNVALGRESGLAGARLFSQLLASPAEYRLTRAATYDAMALCGITHLASRQAGGLSTGERRLVELARCLAGPMDLLLLDEPSSGLDRDETRAFGDVLRAVVAERGLGILLVEHDMSLVMNVCQYIYVLDFGQLIFEGVPAEVAASPIVQAAYLGSESITPV